MTITQLKYIIAVAKYKNFTEASAKSFVTQPTMSMQIQKLEDELEIKIFNRSKKPIELTEIGEIIVEQAKIVIDESNKIIDIIKHQKGHLVGEFKLGIIPTITSTLLPVFLENFTNKYPKINLTIVELTAEEIVQNQIDRKIDASIVDIPLKNEYIVEKPLYYEAFISFIPKNHRLYKKTQIATEDLKTEDLLLLKDIHSFKDGTTNFNINHKTNRKKRVQIECNNFDILIKLSKKGMGMTLLPYLHTLDLNKEDKNCLREFKNSPPTREIRLTHNKLHLKTHIIDALKITINDSIINKPIKGITPIFKVSSKNS